MAAMKIPGYKHCADSPIQQLLPPERVRLPIAEMLPAVDVGDRVEAGTVVARSAPDAEWQRRAHSPLTGRVVAISEPAGEEGPTREVVIEGRAPTETSARPHLDAATLSADRILTCARDAGVVGMSGAQFPTHVKLRPGVPIDCVIVNGSESEPFITCDHRVLAEHRHEVECGMHLAMRAVGATRGEITTGRRGHPFGQERFVISDVLGRDVPDGRLPKDVGVVVINVQTARALHHAVCDREPLLERVITVDGSAVASPGNYTVPIGTEVGHALTQCGVRLDEAAVLVAGGPMMGESAGLETPIGPGTGGVLALGHGQISDLLDRPCVRCGECMESCPFGLPVGLLLEEPNEALLQCNECGVCQFVCAAQRPLIDGIRSVKAELRAGRRQG